jgi:hypothetical protein
MAQDSTLTSTIKGSQGPPALTTNNPTVEIYMMNVDAHLSTKTCDYKTPKSVEKGKDATNPLTPLQIEKAVDETMNHIPKGAFKKASHNQNVRASQNYSIVEDLASCITDLCQCYTALSLIIFHFLFVQGNFYPT